MCIMILCCLKGGNALSRIILVTGGARSGKSDFAERYLAACSGHKAYIATAQILDEEMAERVALHRRRRPASWQTYEVPSGLDTALPGILEAADAVLLDCLTLYFSNFLLAQEKLDFPDIVRAAEKEWDAVLACVRKAGDKTLVVVTNELGSGTVPMAAISRQYRDLIGFLNQRTAQAADEVYLSVCGITTEIKSSAAILPPVGEKS